MSNPQDAQARVQELLEQIYTPGNSSAKVDKLFAELDTLTPETEARLQQLAHDRAAKRRVPINTDTYLQTYDRQKKHNKNLGFVEVSNLLNVTKVLQDATTQKKGVRAAGSGHSYSDVSLGENIFINTHKMNAFGYPLRAHTVKTSDDPKHIRTQAKLNGQLCQEDIKPQWQWATMRKKWRKMSSLKIKEINDKSSVKDIKAVRDLAEGNTQLVEIGAGIRLRDLNVRLKQQDLGLPNMGGYDGQTIIGAISTSTHGSGWTLGPFPDLLKSVVIATTGTITKGNIVSGTANDDVNYYRIEPSNGITDPTKYAANQKTYRANGRDIILIQDDEVFQAVKVTLGAMGVVYSCVIQVMQKYYMTETKTATTLHNWLRKMRTKDGRLPADLSKYRNYSLMVNPYPMHRLECLKLTSSGNLPRNWQKYVMVVEIKRNITPSGETKQRGKSPLDNPKVRNAIANRMNNHPTDIPGIVKAAVSTMTGIGKNKTSENIYDRIYTTGTPGDAGYATETGFSMQPAAGRSGVWSTLQLEKALAAVSKMALAEHWDNNRYLTGPYAVRFVAGTDTQMSMMYQRSTVMIELDMAWGYVHGEETVTKQSNNLIALGGRPHWGLEFSAWTPDPTELKRKFPGFTKWFKVYQQLNAKGTFSNATTQRLGLDKIAATPPRKRKPARVPVSADAKAAKRKAAKMAKAKAKGAAKATKMAKGRKRGKQA